MLVTVALTPYLLILLGLWRRSVLSLRRLGYGPIRIFLRVCLLVGVAAAVLFVVFDGIGALTGSETSLTTLPLALLFLAGVAALVRRKKKLELEITRAMQDRDFTRARRLAEAKPKRLAKSHLLRYYGAVATGLAGDRDRAVDELERLRRDKPMFKYAHLALAAFYLDEGRPEAALQVAEEAAADLHADTDLLVLAAASHEQLGRLDQADAAVARTLAVDSECGGALAVAAGVALQRGDVALARRRIDEAREKAPGAPFVLFVRARIALAADDDAPGAARAVDDLLAAVRANPFAILDRRAAALAEHLPRPTAADR